MITTHIKPLVWQKTPYFTRTQVAQDGRGRLYSVRPLATLLDGSGRYGRQYDAGFRWVALGTGMVSGHDRWGNPIPGAFFYDLDDAKRHCEHVAALEANP